MTFLDFSPGLTLTCLNPKKKFSKDKIHFQKEEERVSDLKENLAKTNMEKDCVEAQKEELKDEIVSLQSKIESVNQAELVAEDKRRKLETELETCTKLNKTLLNQIEELNSSSSEFELKMGEKILEVETRFKNEIAELQAENTEKEKDIIEMGEKLQDTFFAQETWSKEENILKEKINSLLRDIEEEKIKYENLQVS